MMREAVTDKSHLSLLDILLDGIQRFIFRDLFCINPSKTLTSNLALVHRGISTIMFMTAGSANNGTSWKGETGTPAVVSMK
jgi:hypothetical protein